MEFLNDRGWAPWPQNVCTCLWILLNHLENFVPKVHFTIVFRAQQNIDPITTYDSMIHPKINLLSFIQFLSYWGGRGRTNCNRLSGMHQQLNQTPLPMSPFPPRQCDSSELSHCHSIPGPGPSCSRVTLTPSINSHKQLQSFYVFSQKKSNYSPSRLLNQNVGLYYSLKF